MYEQLEPEQRQIRILRVLPGDHGDPIRCTLRAAYLGDDPDYEALSYTWGDLNGSRSSISVDGQVVPVTLNLKAALRRLRQPANHRDLWIDALCINQADEQEKSHQVRLMGLIFSKASQAIMWLGDYAESEETDGDERNASEDSTAAGLTRDQVDKAFGLIEFTASGRHCHNGDDGAGVTSEERIMSVLEVNDRADALKGLMRVAWWHRMWTVQEFILPRHAVLMYGTQSLSRKTLIEGCRSSMIHNFTQCCAYEDIELTDYWHEVDLIRAIMSVSTYRDGTFWEALNIFRPRQTSDPKDRVYALLGLGSDLRPDYSLSLEDIFIGAVRNSIASTGLLHSLLRTTERRRSPTLPRWVPDWCADIPTEGWYSVYFSMSWYYLYGYYDAAGGTKAITREPSEKSALCVQGFLVDQIQAVKPQSWKDGIRAQILRCQALVDDTVKKHGETYPRGGTYDEALWRVCVADVVYSFKDGKPDYRRVTSEDEAYCRKLLRADDGKNLLGSSFFMVDKNFFATETGLLGLCDETVEVGDCVFVLPGGKSPFVLRPRGGKGADGTARYDYVGHAFVHGIMDGQVVTEGRDSAWISLY